MKPQLGPTTRSATVCGGAFGARAGAWPPLPLPTVSVCVCVCVCVSVGLCFCVGALRYTCWTYICMNNLCIPHVCSYCKHKYREIGGETKQETEKDTTMDMPAYNKPRIPRGPASQTCIARGMLRSSHSGSYLTAEARETTSSSPGIRQLRPELTTQEASPAGTALCHKNSPPHQN